MREAASSRQRILAVCRFVVSYGACLVGLKALNDAVVSETMHLHSTANRRDLLPVVTRYQRLSSVLKTLYRWNGTIAVNAMFVSASLETLVVSRPLLPVCSASSGKVAALG